MLYVIAGPDPLRPRSMPDDQRNVFGEEVEICSLIP
jgi:hypothetical protein